MTSVLQILFWIGHCLYYAFFLHSLSLRPPPASISQSPQPPTGSVMSNSSQEISASFSVRALACQCLTLTNGGNSLNFIPFLLSLCRWAVYFPSCPSVVPSLHQCPLWLLAASGFPINLLKPSVLLILQGQ